MFLSNLERNLKFWKKKFRVGPPKVQIVPLMQMNCMDTRCAINRNPDDILSRRFPWTIRSFARTSFCEAVIWQRMDLRWEEHWCHLEDDFHYPEFSRNRPWEGREWPFSLVRDHKWMVPKSGKVVQISEVTLSGKWEKTNICLLAHFTNIFDIFRIQFRSTFLWYLKSTYI